MIPNDSAIPPLCIYLKNTKTINPPKKYLHSCNDCIVIFNRQKNLGTTKYPKQKADKVVVN